MNWEDLTGHQRRAASASERRLLVFGRAGSGKTTVALWCARHFLKTSDAKTWNRVLFLTFSRTAVREISRRSGRALADVRDRVEVQTFHSFANRLIRCFGRYAGLGRKPPALQSDAEAKLLGRSEGHLCYDDLLPLALQVARQPRIKKLLSERWPLVICDEFHDTDDLQWELLCELSHRGRLVLLADPNQMIYDSFLGHRGVGPKRVQQALDVAELVVDLGTPSHRDPTNVIPAMAEAVRQRLFDHDAVRAAIEHGRLRIHTEVSDDLLISLLRDEVSTARHEGARSVAIFGPTNEGVANLSADLMGVGVDNVLVGLSEAHGEALTALELLCLYGLRRTDLDSVRRRLAIFLTASVRGKEPPPLAFAFLGPSRLPGRLAERFDAACEAIQAAGDEGLETLVRAAGEVWPGLGITAGRRAWRQAARSFGAIAHQAIAQSRGNEDEFVVELSRRVSEQKTDSLLDLDLGSGHLVQVMNFHQAKGREADVVILVYRDSDWFGKEDEPFNRSSRLLYVSLTRARRRDVIILPEAPHPLVAPFGQLLR